MLFLLGYIGATPSMNDDMAFLEEYTLLDEIGQGGFATVYKVRHNELGYIRALRVMNAVIARGTEDKTYQRFIDECKLLMRIGNGNHPNIIHISRALLKEQRAAVEMDYVDGTDLTRYVAGCDGFVPADEVIRLLRQMSSALAYCHEDIYRFCMDRVEDQLQDDPEDGSKVLLDEETRVRLIQKYRVIHNDIHSNNIIRREDGNYILLDFGLAVQGEDVVRSSRRSDGAPEFKAPEKWDGDTELTTQSDIYSLGVVLFEFLAGRVPFPLSPQDALSAKAIYLLGEDHKTKTPDSIFELRKAAYEKSHPGETYDCPDYPLWLEEVIMKCLEKNPADRFASGKELNDYVCALIEQESKVMVVPLEADEEPVQVPVAETDDAPQQSLPSEKQRRWAKVNWLLIASVVLALGAVIFGVFKILEANAIKSDFEIFRQQASQTEKSLSEALEEALKPVVPLNESHPAVIYLNDNLKLSRSEMEAIPELHGLWDAINTYDYEAYVSYFPLLQNSDGYLQTMMRMRSSRETLESLMNSGETFVDLDSGDEKIQMISYLFRLLRY